AALEHERNAELARHPLQLAGDIHLQLLGLDHARSGNEEERPIEAGVETAELHGIYAAEPPITLSPGSGTRCLCCSSAARMNELKSGCPSRGVEVNSGWYWQPKNHGWSASSAISVRSSAFVFALMTR